MATFLRIWDSRKSHHNVLQESTDASLCRLCAITNISTERRRPHFGAGCHWELACERAVYPLSSDVPGPHGSGDPCSCTGPFHPHRSALKIINRDAMPI